MSLEVLTLKESSSIAAAAYDPDERTLRITFTSDGRHQERTYDYLQVPPETVEEFLDADSHGIFVNARIKPRHDCREVV